MTMTKTTKQSSTGSMQHPCSSSRVEKENCNNSPMKPSTQSVQQPTTAATRGIRGRRQIKSALYFALTILCTYCSILPTTTHAFATTRVNRRSGLYERKSEWVERSVQYYSTVMRKAPSSSQTSQLPHIDSTTTASDNDIATQDEDFVRLATKHYYARHLIKRGSWEQAEKLYRRIINELTSEGDEHCDHSKLAVSTLLLALHMQRVGDTKGTRAVFLNFFRRVAMDDEEEEEVECSCSAKVLQAYALFEMKNGNERKSLEIIQKAVRMDSELSPVLEWKQFRDAKQGRKFKPSISFNRTYSPLDRRIQNMIRQRESCETSPTDDVKYVPIRRREIFSAGGP